MGRKRKKEKRRKSGKRMTKHHIIPRSRGGTSSADNLLEKTEAEHCAYHRLFGNALPEEAVLILIKEWFYKEPKYGIKLQELLFLIRQKW